MISKYIKNLCAFGALCFALSNQAIFYRACRWVSQDGNSIDLFSDRHTECQNPQLPFLQKNAIVQAAYACDALVIAEDSAQYPGNNPDTAAYVQKVKKVLSPLSNLIDACHARSVACYNVDFRHDKLAGFIGKCAHVTGQSIFAQINCIAHEIKNYNDAPFLKKYYCDVVSDVYADHRKLLAELQKSTGAAHRFFEQLNEEEKKYFYFFDKKLINARIIHQIYSNRNHKHIFVCAGAIHIKVVEKLLSHLGYSLQYETNKDVLCVDGKITDVKAYFDKCDSRPIVQQPAHGKVLQYDGPSVPKKNFVLKNQQTIVNMVLGWYRKNYIALSKTIVMLKKYIATKFSL